jgi:hypothetical protein
MPLSDVDMRPDARVAGSGTATGTLLALSALTLLLHAVVGARYGYFRDELYYLACSDRLAWGYVDHPPFSILVLRLARALLGDSLWAIRLPAWLAGAAAVFTTGLIARELGGRRFAQALSAICVIVGPVYLAVAHFYSMNALDLLFWAVSAYALARALRSPGGRWWLALGVLLGLGLHNKFSILWLGAGIGAALLLTSERRWLATKWPWMAAAIALALFAPHIAWQFQNGWPTREFIHNATTVKMADISPLEFLVNQVVVQHPATLPVWAVGLVFLLARHRALAWLFIAPALILVISGSSRANYLSPAFPILFAGGAVAIEVATRRRAAWTRGAIVSVLLLAGAMTAPMALPLLPVGSLIRYSDAIGLAPRAEENTDMGALPQHFADQFGWPGLAREVAAVYQALPADDRRKAAIFATNYGRAGAIDFFGRDLGLPPAISGHNNYFLWGPRGHTGELVIVVGGAYDEHASSFDEVREVRSVPCTYCMPYENGVRIFVCRRLKVALRDAWPAVKEYI